MSGAGWRPALGLLAWLCCVGPAPAGKVLVVPMDGSHWLSMKILVKELIHRGHEILVLVPEHSLLLRSSDGFRTRFYRVPFSKEEMDGTLSQLSSGVFLKPAAFTDLLVNLERLVNFTSLHVRGCRGLFDDRPAMSQLEAAGFDLLLTDPFIPCGPVLSRLLAVPAVYFLRGLPCGLEVKAVRCPSPLSYVPVSNSGNTHVMNFGQRLKNALMAAVESVICRYIYARFDELVGRYLGDDLTYGDVLSQGAVWLLRYDFALEWPKPVMPNMFFIGGVTCETPAPLPADLQEFVDGSGDDGFIVFTMGTMVSTMPKEKAQLFMEVFRQIPQRVLWRYTSVALDNVPKNVRLMKWLPQNDLLAHPKARVFITHGGSHGIYESICNAVPMLVFPLFGDQEENAQRMELRGVAEKLSIHDVTAEALLMALNKVIHQKSYAENMKKLSQIHLDRPVEPLDLAVFWTEFVMRHGGASHLQAAAHNMNWFQYQSLDVIGFLLLVVFTTLWLTLKCCMLCARKCCTTRTAKSKLE